MQKNNRLAMSSKSLFYGLQYEKHALQYLVLFPELRHLRFFFNYHFYFLLRYPSAGFICKTFKKSVVHNQINAVTIETIFMGNATALAMASG
jgi:hypothetical protein